MANKKYKSGKKGGGPGAKRRNQKFSTPHELLIERLQKRNPKEQQHVNHLKIKK